MFVGCESEKSYHSNQSDDSESYLTISTVSDSELEVLNTALTFDFKHESGSNVLIETNKDLLNLRMVTIDLTNEPITVGAPHHSFGDVNSGDLILITNIRWQASNRDGISFEDDFGNVRIYVLTPKENSNDWTIDEFTIEK